MANLIPMVGTFLPMYALHPRLIFGYADWRVAGGSVNSSYSYQAFQDILKNGTTFDTGFVLGQILSRSLMLMR